MPAERNFDVRNSELLALVLALQEWRHWLEGFIFPFTAWTDHKNLSYLRSACGMNSRQAWWALFLGHLNFSLTYQPLSPQFSRRGNHMGRPCCLHCVWLELPGGRSKGWSMRPKRTIWILKAVHPTSCLCLRLPGLRYSSGNKPHWFPSNPSPLTTATLVAHYVF